MGRRLKVLSVCVLFFLVVSLPASAGTIYSFSSIQLTGNSGSSVSGQFSFDSSTRTFTNVTISFAGGVFDNVKVSDLKEKAKKTAEGYLYTWSGHVGKDKISYSILFDPSTGHFREWGGIYKGRYNGDFDTLAVPEGGAELTYLMLSAFAVFGGILISGKQRRATRSSQSG